MPDSNSHRLALKTLRGFNHNYEISRECLEIIEIVEAHRSGEVVSTGWAENPLSCLWPRRPFSDIPEDLLATQWEEWGNKYKPSWLKPCGSYYDNELKFYSLEIRLPPSVTLRSIRDLADYLVATTRKARKRADVVRYVDQLQMLAAKRQKEICLDEEAALKLLLHPDGTKIYSHKSTFRRACRAACRICDQFTTEALIRIDLGFWFPPFGPHLISPVKLR
jgi:hypothetical protein